MSFATAAIPTFQADPVHRQQCLDQAARCRRLAFAATDREAAEELLAMAADYERIAWPNRSAP